MSSAAIFGFCIIVALVGVVLAIPAAILYVAYTRWNDLYKVKFMSSLATVVLVITLCVVLFSIGYVAIRMGTSSHGDVNSRMKRLSHYADNNFYEGLSTQMQIKEAYEEEFEPYWERLLMHDYTFKYRVYHAAEEAGLGDEYKKKAEKYETLMKNLCENPVYPENNPYAAYFLEKSTN